jgi:uncharacterized protein (DUF1778 family)
MSPARKTHTIIFRITDEELQRVEAAAHVTGKEVNEWSREATLAQASQPGDLLPVERLLYEEVARMIKKPASYVLAPNIAGAGERGLA